MADTLGGGGDLSSFMKSRFVEPADLLNKLNPLRLHVHGTGVDGIGGDPAQTGPFYVFVTRPDLNLDPAEAVSALALGKPTAPNSIASMLKGGAGIIPLITNLVEGINPSDISLDIHSIGEGWDGSKLPTPRSTLNSRQDGTLQLDIGEWSGLPATKLHKIWVDYIEYVAKGILSPKVDYMKGRILDYAVSIYYFQCRPDGATIEFGVRFTGCFPTAVPFSPWTGRIGSQDAVKLSIPYAYSYMEPMDHIIFEEFASHLSNSGCTLQLDGRDGQRPAYKLSFAQTGSYPVSPEKFEFL
jgi:hypothetical protein